MLSLLSQRLRCCLGGSILTLAVLAGSSADGYTPCATGPTYSAPYAGPVNYAQAAPPFQWGWFGAERHYPQPSWHRDYNGDLMRWSTHRRY
ncbi:hypothetical protein Pla108_34870 [Botrimarina colliarenosi]|uniref:YXWGXW repeat (2 copies) n=1 Tax=Botrimarina colliarenosi TaxID=2528001 RepID=A0A5C6A8J3_9BACT|nr:hypothetical protein [Botrimarina colliarenosi]TWT95341.1 hypothetical protein Pla108_34870 [Botrimarina colliarenosi]